MTSPSKRFGRPARRSPVRSGRKTSQHYDTGWLERLKKGNAAITHFEEIRKRRPSAR